MRWCDHHKRNEEDAKPKENQKENNTMLILQSRKQRQQLIHWLSLCRRSCFTFIICKFSNAPHFKRARLTQAHAQLSQQIGAAGRRANKPLAHITPLLSDQNFGQIRTSCLLPASTERKLDSCRPSLVGWHDKGCVSTIVDRTGNESRCQLWRVQRSLAQEDRAGGWSERVTNNNEHRKIDGAQTILLCR